MKNLTTESVRSPFQDWQKKFDLVTNNGVWRFYLRWVYKKCIQDLSDWGSPVKFNKVDFTALLCGTAGAATSKEFIDFILSHNPQAKIIILDLGENQIKDSKRMVKNHYPSSNIECIQADARSIPLKSSSIDLIETDGVFEFMSGNDVKKTLKEWNRILSIDGKCTFRDFASYSFFPTLINNMKLFIGKTLFKAQLFNHTYDEFIKMFNEANFEYLSAGGALVPTLRRFVLRKSVS